MILNKKGSLSFHFADQSQVRVPRQHEVADVDHNFEDLHLRRILWDSGYT